MRSSAIGDGMNMAGLKAALVMSRKRLGRHMPVGSESVDGGIAIGRSDADGPAPSPSLGTPTPATCGSESSGRNGNMAAGLPMWLLSCSPSWFTAVIEQLAHRGGAGGGGR